MKKIVKLFILGILVLYPCMVHAETLDINSEEVKTIITRYQLEDNGLLGPRLLEKGAKTSLVVSSISDKEAATLTSLAIEDKQAQEEQKCPADSEYGCYSITKETYENAFKSIFGPDMAIKNNTVFDKGEYNIYTYDATNNKYFSLIGPTGYSSYGSFVTKATKETDSISIYLKGFMMFNEGNYELKNLNQESTKINLTGVDNITNMVKQKYADYLDTYKLILKKASDSNYYFYSVENLNDAKEYKNTVVKTSTKVENPKTADINVFGYIGMILGTMLVLGISVKKVKSIK